MRPFVTWMESTGALAPWCFLGLFVAASFLMIWRLEAMSESGVEGTVLGTLVMPYCSGMGNLIFAFVLGAKGGPGAEVLTNSLVNNVTNMTLIIGLPTMLWGMSVLPVARSARKKKPNTREHRINRLSLLLTLTAVLFFTGAVWALARNGTLDFGDGLVLVGLFLFWQCFHVFDVLKNNVRQNKSFSWMLPLDLAALAIGAYAIYLSTNWLVGWLSGIQTGFVSARHLGWLSGWLMVLPNALLAFYYARRGNPEVVYTSQVGDGHISIPLCIGIFALYHPIKVPPFFHTGVAILLGTAVVHFLFIATLGRLPRFMGWILTGTYAVFLYQGLGT
ncbi:MAG TPA: sodium:calcium symporter [Candidatus Paceibacterota bacterium]|nr:sodium:calcium symporter [Verrucomicrobiota bacterium]HSA10526.1 sodium:calcium symporter [Candidatus Paceibacterota bacterium]